MKFCNALSKTASVNVKLQKTRLQVLHELREHLSEIKITGDMNELWGHIIYFPVEPRFSFPFFIFFILFFLYTFISLGYQSQKSTRLYVCFLKLMNFAITLPTTKGFFDELKVHIEHALPNYISAITYKKHFHNPIVQCKLRTCHNSRTHTSIQRHARIPTYTYTHIPTRIKSGKYTL